MRRFRCLHSVTVRDANADGYLDRGEALELDVRVINAAPNPASNLTGVLAAANMGVPAVMTVSQPDALNAVNLNSQTVPRLLSPPFGVDVDANAPKGALQRFHVTLDGINQYNGQPVRIPLEIRLRADGRIELMGAVSFADGANTEANMQATRIRLQLDNGYDRAIRPLLEGDGVYRYRFGNLPIGIAGAVSVSQVPPGYTVPPAVALAPLVDDVQVDFVIPDGTLDAIVTVPAGLAFTLQEGQSVAGSVTIQNTGGAAEDLHVEIRYRRRQDEAVEPAFAAAEAVAETEPKRKSVDWPSVDPDAISPDEVIVRFTPGLKQADMEAALAQAGLEPVFFFSSFPAALARRIAGDIEPVAYAAEAASIEEDKRILQIAPDDKASRFAILPDDPRFDELFGLLNLRQTGGSLGADIGVTQVWARTTGSHEIIVAVADTGIMVNHEDLAANIWVNPAPGSYTNTIVGDIHGWNFFDWSPDVMDWHGHGTHVAGTIGAVGNNTIGIAGVNWQVSLMALRLTDPFGGFTTSARIAKAIEYAAWHGAHVSNHSWGGPDTAGVMHDAIVYAASRNHLVIAAGGNDAYDLDEKRTYPAAYGGVLDNVITVSAVDHHDELAVFSNFGAKTAQLGAPGVDILSTIPDLCVMKLYEVWPWDARYGLSSGTSMAAPHVAGAAGLLWSLTPHSGYKVIRDALLNGVRPVPHLKDWVSTGGVLDVARSAQTLGDDWLTVDTYAFVLPAGGSRVLALTVNDPAVLPARSEAYLAAIIVRRADRSQSIEIPVSATVTPGAAWLAIQDVTINRMGAPDDGLAPSPGETVELNVTLHNRGQATATSLIGTLTGGAASTIEQAHTAWSVLYGGEASAGDVPLRVVLDHLAAGTLDFDLEIRRNGVLLDTLNVSVPILPGRRVRGRIVDADGEPVSGARVEVFGASGGRAISEADGGFALRGLADGVHHLRILPQAHTRQTVSNAFDPAVTDDIGTFVVSAPLPAFDPLVEQPVVHGFKSQGILTITNSGTVADGPFAYSIHLAPEYRVAVVSDGTSLGELVQPLHDMGFSVSYYSNNFARIQYFMPAVNAYQVLQDVRYTHEHAFLADFDAVILDMSGPEGTGRLLSSAEESAFAAYTARGGRLILTGANPFSRPDNAGLANLIGTHVLDRAADAEAQSESWQTFDSPFAVLQPGEYLRNITELRHDLATPIVGTAGAAVQTGAAAKLLHRTRPNDGALYVWTGNRTGADWSAPGLWQDVLRGILWNELITGTSRQLPWLHLVDAGGVLHHTMSGTLAPGADADITLSMHAAYPVQLEDYHAVAIVLGNYDGADVRSVRITMQVVPALLRAFTTGQVRDWRGLPLQGDGSSRSALLQVIWTGPDGVISPPTIEGLPTGQNELLTAFEAGLTHARFGGGAGVAPDMGRFDWAFRHRIPAVDGQSNTVFVRAWDAETFNRSLVYGDSALYELQFEPGEAHNFGSWPLLQILQYNRDSNNDSVPDGWLIENMPWLDPRDPVQPLVSSGVYSNSIPIPAAREPAEPRRVAVTDALIFVLDMMNHRILVYDRASGGITNVIGKAGGDPAAGQWGGWPGTGPGEFTMPSGFALDPRTGVNRLVVADTQSSRIQVLTFDPVNGQVTHVLVFGSAGTDPGQLKRPRGVAVMDGNGDIFVADTENNRVAVFSAAGVHRWSFTGNAGFTLRNPRGIAVDLDDGVFVADTDNYRIVRFTALGMGVAVIHPPVGDANAFADPTDVHIWRHRWVDGAGIVQREVRRLIVADRYHNRIQLREMDGTHLLNIGRHGILNGELRLPYGAFPVNDSPYLYVADTGNLRIQKFQVVLDADGDGMDDFWEDMNGLDSTANDAMDAWPSRPDIKNIYAFRASLVGEDPDDLIVGVSFTATVGGVSGSGLILSVQRAEMVTTAESGEPQQIQLSWASVAGRRYRVERVETLGGVWQTVRTYESTGTTSSVSVPMDLTRGFFRIVVDQ
jgi:DNA-binding beta-propeller fold protein YncE